MPPRHLRRFFVSGQKVCFGLQYILSYTPKLTLAFLSPPSFRWVIVESKASEITWPMITFPPVHDVTMASIDIQLVRALVLRVFQVVVLCFVHRTSRETKGDWLNGRRVD